VSQLSTIKFIILNVIMLSVIMLNILTPKSDIRDLCLIILALVMEQRFKNVSNCWNTNIYSYLGTSGGQNTNLYLNVVHFFIISVN
jgi:hypothetical protein